ncbi:MAG: hypothetical protein MK183_11970 [Verrucomicrobiales bacterium]|nr:hypothetical protein [Verrucomicrobiales bacterium]
MDITDEQKNKITEWISQGEDLGSIQSLLRDELGITLTYVETRFLLADLELEPGDETEEEQAGDAEVEESSGEVVEEDQAVTESPAGDKESPAGDNPPIPEQDSGCDSSVAVTVDSLMKPGAVISGKVTFSDGEGGSWMIDQMGQLRLDPETEDYRPSQEDIQKFQMELQKAASSQGL